MQRRDNYACNRVRIFLNELGQGTHNSKFKALNDFHSYLDTHRPLVSLFSLIIFFCFVLFYFCNILFSLIFLIYLLLTYF